jgi:uncharacterized protein
MNKEPTINEFLLLASPILKDPRFRELKKYPHHGHISIRRHVLNVAYLCYKHGLNKKNISINELIRAALLHDYYLYDWHDRTSHNGIHGFNHPLIALINAKRDFSLTRKECRIILSHMWPLTFLHFPTSKEAWILCYYDKVATCIDNHKCHLNKKNIKKQKVAKK